MTIPIPPQRQGSSKRLYHWRFDQTQEHCDTYLRLWGHNNTFEDELRPQRVRETLPGQQELWIGYTDFVFSEPAQKSKPSFRVIETRSAAQQKLHKQGLRLKVKALRLVEAMLANRPSGETDPWTTDGEVWSRHHVLPGRDPCLPEKKATTSARTSLVQAG